jgi:probable HAF family extracellular repeat protein
MKLHTIFQQACILSIASASVFATPLFAAGYKLVDLGVLPGDTNSIARAINDNGQVMGTSTPIEPIDESGNHPSTSHGFIWQQGKLTNLGTLGGNVNNPYAINNKGQVVGSSLIQPGSNSVYVEHAYIWDNGRLKDLGSLYRKETGKKDNISEAIDINDKGLVIGTSNPVHNQGYPQEHAILWQKNGKLIDISANTVSSVGNSIGFDRAHVIDINNNGQVIYYVQTVADNGLHYYLWDNGSTANLGNFSFYTHENNTGLNSMAINDKGQVLGQISIGSGEQHFAIWKDKKITDLGNITGCPMDLDGGCHLYFAHFNNLGHIAYSTFQARQDGTSEFRNRIWRNGSIIELPADYFVSAINDQDQAVGYAGTKPFIWNNGVITVLKTLGGQYSNATGINNKGQIVGSSQTASGETHAVMWQPI